MAFGVNTAKYALRRSRKTAVEAGLWLRDRIGWTDSFRKVAEDAQKYWSLSNEGHWQNNSHWRSGSVFSGKDGNWLKLGAAHIEIYAQFARACDFPRPVERIVEWGSGGGANAVHFAKECREFVGVDVVQASLDECQRQVKGAGAASFVPVLIPVSEPEVALSCIHEPCDLFLCTYVFELIPTREYGLRLLRIAHALLRPGGMALVQIKYDTGERGTGSRRLAYAHDPANMTTYRLDAFWTLAKDCGFEPRLLHLVPHQPLVGDGRYGYFCLSRT